jgi:glycosyltransferase involved in cell wall biosynthesis
MKILLLTQNFPYPPSNGGMLRTHHIVAGISEEHHVDLLCFSAGPPKEVPYRNVRVHTATPRLFSSGHRAVALLRPMPVYPLMNHSASMSELIEQICRTEAPDVAHIDTLGMASYITKLNIPAVVDVMDCISLHFQRLTAIQTNPLRRLLYSFETSKIKRFERRVAAGAAAVVCCTRQDAGCLESVTQKKVLTIPNGVQLPAVAGTPPARNAGKPVLVFVGILDYSANRDAIRFFGDQILPLIQRSFPDAIFEVVGKGKPVELVNMANVRYRGYVEDLDSVYAGASLVIAPVRLGSGIKNKVLEGMAYSLPVVATSIGVEGIGGIDGRHYFVADTPGIFAAHVVKLLSDARLASNIGTAARAYVQEQFMWSKTVNQFLNVYENVREGRIE